MKYIIASLLIFLSSIASAHEMTPTYPKWETSHLDGLLTTTMKMFNKRAEVEYYEIGVFDEEWNPIPFVTSYNVIKIEYLGHVTFDLYIRKADKSRAVYICSISKLRKSNEVRTAITSKICSKAKSE
jgi:hypothetical protein